MADHRAEQRLRMTARSAGALVLAALAAACDTIGGPAGYAVVTQDKYDFQTCPEIIAARNGAIARDKELTDLIAKAETVPTGYIVGAVSYRTDQTVNRANLRAAERAIALKNCTEPKPAPATPPPPPAASPQRSSR